MQPTSAVPDAVDTPDEPATRRSPMRFIVPLGFVAAFAALGFIGYNQMTASDDEAVAGRAPATTVAAEAPPLVAPIDDAQDVVDEINDNTGEDELVDDLDVDDVQAADRSIGATIEFRPGDLVDDDHISAAESAAFSYSYQRGEAPGEQVWVDAATTNRESFDGTTWRRTVDGTHYATEDPAGVWALAPTPPADSLASLPSMLTLPDVLPEGLIEAIGASMGDGIDGRYIIADTDFAAAPEARAAWLAFWGFDPTSPVVEAAGFVDAVPDAASAGQILISVRASSDGIVTRVYIDAPSFGTSIGYSLVGVSSEALVVPAPDVGG